MWIRHNAEASLSTVTKMPTKSSDEKLERLFCQVTDLVGRNPSTDTGSDAATTPVIINAEKLRLYGLYKRVHNGTCGNTVLIPSIFQPLARSKFLAWMECSSLSRQDAMQEYIRVVFSRQDELGKECRLLCDENSHGDGSKICDENGDKNSKLDVISFTGIDENIDKYSNERNGNDIKTNQIVEVGIHKINPNRSCAAPFNATTTTTTTAVTSRISSIYDTMLRWLGVKPLIPRGRLDISYRDLAFAMHQSIISSGIFFHRRKSKLDHDRLKNQIGHLWSDSCSNTINDIASDGYDGDEDENKFVDASSAASDDHHKKVVVGLSVRSLFDLYLTMKSYPDNSEILVVPPINVPGMMHVARYHNLRIVPVDILLRSAKNEDISSNDQRNNNQRWIDIESTKSKITDKTVAIMVVHPFGIVTADSDTMENLRRVADNHQIELWEDCAECFVGLGKGVDGVRRIKTTSDDNMTYPTNTTESSPSFYVGSAAYSDVRFFSFGPIKTATALGGGVALLRTFEASNHMERLQQTLYTNQQTCHEYFFKVITAFILNFIADSPLRVGVLLRVCQIFGLDFDTLVTYAIRGFRVPTMDKSSTTNTNPNKVESSDRWVQSNMVRQIRKKPSWALLAVLYRRIKQSKHAAPSALARMVRCNRIESILQQNLPEILLPDLGGGIMNTFWAFPICCQDRDLVSREMKYCGFDIATGASQLCSLSTFTRITTEQQRKEVCPSTDDIMNSVLYLPICSQQLSESTIMELIECLKDTLGKSSTFCVPNRSMVEEVGKSNVRLTLLSLVMMFLWIMPRSVYYAVIVLCQAFFIFFVIRIVAEILLRWTTSELYLKESSAFAENCDMIDVEYDSESLRVNQLSKDEPDRQRQGVLSRINALKLSIQSSSIDTLEKRKVMLTGATGFVGSALLRDLLLHRQILSLETVIVLCRKKGGVSAEQRIENLLNTPMFAFLSDGDKGRMVEVMEGDVKIYSAGLSPVDLAKITQDSRISHIFHCAAAVSFTLELPNAAQSNITSALNMQTLTGRLKNKEAQFVHVSTAFVHGNKTGSTNMPLSEELFNFELFDPFEIYRSMLGTQFYASKAMAELGFPNTYSFSKSVCEHVLTQNQQVNTVIIRPSIVGPAIETPFEGWSGDRPSTIVAGACLHLSSPWNIHHLGKESITFIPVDVLVRFILTKVFSDNSNESAASIDEYSSSDGSFERINDTATEIDSQRDYVGSSFSSHDEVRVMYRFPTIYNATWSTEFNENILSSWLEFSVTYVQLGSVMGCFSRSIALMTLFISAQLIPWMNPTYDTFDKLQAFFIRPPFQVAAALYNYIGLPSRQLAKLIPLLDLPLLFYPFVRNEFHFRSELVAPGCFDVKRYFFSCGVAAHRFVASRKSSLGTNSSSLKKMSCFTIGGRNYSLGSSYIWWAFSQPKGDFFVRLAAAFIGRLLWMIASSVTIDIISFRKHLSAMKAEKDGPVHLILVPTHRSFLDFILLTYVFFSLPELQIDLPFIIASDEFEHLPVIGWLARRLRAFYVQRGKGRIDPTLSKRMETLKDHHVGASFEVFIEGRRSRDRRFVKPKTGLLKSMKVSSGSHVILPITINYECIPEQQHLSKEAAGTERSMLNVTGMIRWLYTVMRGRIYIGKIHIAASDPISMERQHDFQKLVDHIQLQQQTKIYVSEYHLRAASKLLDIKGTVVKSALTKLGCQFWPTTGVTAIPDLPTDPTSLLTIVLHFGHVLAPLFFNEEPKWCFWLNRVFDSSIQTNIVLDDNIQLLYNRMNTFFYSADQVIDEAILKLKNTGFSHPSVSHIFQVSKSKERLNVPLPILHAAILMQYPVMKDQVSVPVKSNSITDATLCGSNEKLGFWGFADSGFIAQIDKRGRRYMTMKGARYALCKKPLFKILPFIESELQVKIDLSREFNSIHSKWFSEVESSLSAIDLTYLGNLVERTISISTLDRARHGTGHSQEDVFALRNGQNIRIPDAVVWPCSEKEVVALVNAGRQKGWCLIPHGGGTNVIEATRCPNKQVEPRPILSVSMKHMNRILWLNEVDGLACFEAGITGRELAEILCGRGYTMGHEPDSIEFSTLGGWVATKASGMKRSKYGNIEDIVVSTTIVTSCGVLRKESSDKQDVPGRHSEGIDVHTLALGSEGCLGIITSVIVRVWSVPEVKKFDGIMFPSFADGLHFVRSLSKERRMMLPSCVRLLDNAHFRLGQALRPDEPTLFYQAKAALEKAVVSLYLPNECSPESVVCATICYEGSDREVRDQMSTVKQQAELYGGTRLGPRVGKAGYELTYMIAYLRDFAMTYHILGESFETFVPWSKVETLIAATKERIIAEHNARMLPGVPFIGCRITQLYHEGACLYFYLCMSFDGVDRASAVFADLERAARDEILKQGGSLSHHHGLGKLRSSFAKERSSVEFQNIVASLKDSIDKDNIFGARNGFYAK